MFRSRFLATLIALYASGANAHMAFWYPADPVCKSTRGNLVPDMTNNTAPSGQASASGSFSAGYQPFNAFDQAVSATGWYEATLVLTGWLQYMFATAQVIRKYSILPPSGFADSSPKNWTFQGSQDGIAWTTLDTRTGETFPTDTTLKTYTFTNSTAYLYYRIDITLNNGSLNWVGIGALSLCEY